MPKANTTPVVLTLCAICDLRPVTPGFQSCEPCRAYLSDPSNPVLLRVQRQRKAIEPEPMPELFDVPHGRRKGPRWKE